MNSKIPGLAFIGLIIGPMYVHAQFAALEYQSQTLTGTTTFYSGPTPSYLLTPEEYAAAFSTAPFIGNITVSLNLPNASSLSGMVDILGNNGTSIDLGFDVNAAHIGGAPLAFTTYAGSSGTVDLTTSNGAITGATMDVDFSSYHGSSLLLAIGPGGDSVSYTYQGTNGPCTDPASGGGPNPCTIVASNTSAGVWRVTEAPEMDTASAASGLMLLLGSAAVLRGRRCARVR